MDVFNTFRETIGAEIGKLGASPGAVRFSVEPPRDPGHGEISTNAALVHAKALGRKPREVSEALRTALAGLPEVLEASVAGPASSICGCAPGSGATGWATFCAPENAMARPGSGRAGGSTSNMSRPTRRGRMHVGHGRGAVVGDALAALMAKVARRHPRILRQRRRRADRCPCALAPPPLSRGRRRGRGAARRGALSRRLPDRDRERAPGARWRTLAGRAGERVAAAAARVRRRSNDGADQGRSRRAGHRP